MDQPLEFLCRTDDCLSEVWAGRHVAGPSMQAFLPSILHHAVMFVVQDHIHCNFPEPSGESDSVWFCRWLHTRFSEGLPFSCPLCRCDVLRGPQRTIQHIDRSREMQWEILWTPVTITRDFYRELSTGHAHVQTVVDRPTLLRGPTERQVSVAIIPFGRFASFPFAFGPGKIHDRERTSSFSYSVAS